MWSVRFSLLFLPQILRNCFKYLNLKTIGNCRLVSKFWNQAATSYFRQRSYVHFKFAEEIYGFLNVMESCQDFPYQKFILHIFEHELDHPLVRLLFEKFGATMTSVTLNLQGNSRYAYKDPDPQAFRCILDLPNVEEIKLYGLPENILEQGNLFDASSFPRLKSLSFSIHSDKYGTNNLEVEEGVDVGKRRALIFNILKVSKSLQCLEVGSIRADCARRILQEVDLSRLKIFKTLPFTVATLHLPFCVDMNLKFPSLTQFSCFFDKSASSEDLYELICNLPALEYLRLRGGQGLTNFPTMTRLKEVHLLTLCTLTATELADKLPSVHTLNFVLNPIVYNNKNFNSMDQGDVTAVSDRYLLNSVQVTLHDCQHVDSCYMIPLLMDVRRLPCVSCLRLLAGSEIIGEIFKYFRNLEELHIDDGSVISDEDITGISSDALYSHPNDDQDEVCVTRLGPFIGDLIRKFRIMYIITISVG